LTGGLIHFFAERLRIAQLLQLGHKRGHAAFSDREPAGRQAPGKKMGAIRNSIPRVDQYLAGRVQRRFSKDGLFPATAIIHEKRALRSNPTTCPKGQLSQRGGFG
jgi:hypothetical protein